MSEETVYFHLMVFPGTGNASIVIKTPHESMTFDQAIRICRRIAGMEFPPDVESLGAELKLDRGPSHRESAIRTIEVADSVMTVRDALPDGTVFYREPGHVVPVSLFVTDPAGTAPPRHDEVTVPAFLVDRDCTGEAVRGFLRSVVADYVASGTAVGVPTWDVLSSIPAGFLARYGIAVKHHDNGFLSMAVSADEPVFPDGTNA